MVHFLLFILFLIGLYEIKKIIELSTNKMVSQVNDYAEHFRNGNKEHFRLTDNLEGGYVYNRYSTMPSNWNENLEYHLDPPIHDRKKRFIDANSIKPHNIDLENDGILNYQNFEKQKYPRLKKRTSDWKCQREWSECAYYPPHLNKPSSDYKLGEPHKFDESSLSGIPDEMVF